MVHGMDIEEIVDRIYREGKKRVARSGVELEDFLFEYVMPESHFSIDDRLRGIHFKKFRKDRYDWVGEDGTTAYLVQYWWEDVLLADSLYLNEGVRGVTTDQDLWVDRDELTYEFYDSCMLEVCREVYEWYYG